MNKAIPIRCPRCDQQGQIRKALIKKTNEVVLLCDECDALWRLDMPLSAERFLQLAPYLESQGLFAYLAEYDFIEDHKGGSPEWRLDKA